MKELVEEEEKILKYHRVQEADEKLMPFGEIITMIDELW